MSAIYFVSHIYVFVAAGCPALVWSHFSVNIWIITDSGIYCCRHGLISVKMQKPHLCCLFNFDPRSPDPLTNNESYNIYIYCVTLIAEYYAILLPLCQSLWLGTKVYELSPGHFSLEKQNTVCRGKGNDCQRLNMTICRHPSSWEQCSAISVRQFLTRGGHLGEVHCATRINVIYNDTNKLCSKK